MNERIFGLNLCWPTTGTHTFVLSFIHIHCPKRIPLFFSLRLESGMEGIFFYGCGWGNLDMGCFVIVEVLCMHRLLLVPRNAYGDDCVSSVI